MSTFLGLCVVIATGFIILGAAIGAGLAVAFSVFSWIVDR